MPEIGMITTTESGVDLVVEWTIEEFFNFPKSDGAYYNSPSFSFDSERWSLDIYPDGFSLSDSSGHVDLRLCKWRSDRTIKLSFSLSLKTAKGEKYNEQHITKGFDEDNYFYMFNRLIPRSELSRRRSDLVPEGVLTVICTMKSSTSARRGIGNVASASAECCHCKETFNVGRLSSHQKKCMHRPVKCPDCLEVVLLQKLFNEHECQQKRPEVELLKAKSEIDALKLNYNQALQDKAEAQTKLRVLTKNFKDKEIELQRQLSAKEADRQKKENDLNSSKRRIMLIEQENASYQSQIAGLKQKMEEKERTLKRQIAAQEKKADENRIAACAAEKNLKNMEQEVTQLRQRLALLEREQENWTKAATDEIVRPVPKTCVETCTQTVEERLEYEPERAYVETCTQTLEEEFSFNNPTEDCDFLTDINHLLKENRGVDVTFELETPNGKTKLFAHKLILAVMSSYFADEFYDKERSEGHQVIPLKGIDPKAFEQMIRYCYGEKLSLRTTEDACALFKVAFEFKVISLQNLCHAFFMHAKIEPGNVFSILKISVEMEDKSLKDMCFKILQEKTREVMSAYELCDITPAMVYTLLNLPKLSLNSEYELINWIFDWAKLKSEDKNSSCRSTRDYLAKLLRNMNFLALTVKEFAMLTRDNPKFFNSDEIASVSMNIVIPGTREMPVWHNEDLKVRVYTGSNE